MDPVRSPTPVSQAGQRPVREGDVLRQGLSAPGLTEQVRDDLLPLLPALKPEDVSTTLHALPGACRRSRCRAS